ncbi:MAG: cryptochrome/photolyase family protein [Burkholderiales bacterium]|nr:cryptochrome/photolyase family protein [Burkholderiales bacterium]OUT79635.1 MAG: cryptochrome/photolyase family protein [Betaproteobacteria bacterium TMED22]|tara:strand:- start:1171 stop:2697 length:1527 start_codon:yes stop_codon:yes gene_type:complete
MKELRLILGDQLNLNHSWYQVIDPSVIYLMMEVASEAERSPQHAQKILGTFAAMRAFSESLTSLGHRVHYVTISAPDNQQSFSSNVSYFCQKFAVSSFVWQEPDSWYVDQELKKFFNSSSLDGGDTTTEHFLEPRDGLSLFMKSRSIWKMENWYRHLRVKHNVLMEEGKPIGGAWNFDKENRKSWRGDPSPDSTSRPTHDHSALWSEIIKAKVITFGNPDAAAFQWPSNRDESLAMLKRFCDTNLQFFGDYQDAMSEKSQTLFHSLLSFSLNLKMISPHEVLNAALDALEPDHNNIASVEGFVRQVLGWREYVRGIYWAKMPDYLSSNAFAFSNKLPAWFWTGEVDMKCMNVTINQSLDTAYAHHIQRLMIVGNFSLLAGLDPRDVHLWYLGIYIDALEWVEVPNTIGMSQYADGGILATKPYVSSSAYINRMSDYCKSCKYQRKEKHGAQSCPFDTLYWDFLITHRKAFKNNPRMAMMLKNIDRKTESEMVKIAARARDLRDNIENL